MCPECDPRFAAAPSTRTSGPASVILGLFHRRIAENEGHQPEQAAANGRLRHKELFPSTAEELRANTLLRGCARRKGESGQTPAHTKQSLRAGMRELGAACGRCEEKLLEYRNASEVTG